MLCVLDVRAQSADYGVEIFGVGVEAFENASAPDVSKALYGKIAGLNVYQGSGSSADNISKLSVHGRTPLVLVDGFERDLSDLTSCEIESVRLLTDAASAALYGVRGANGVLLVTTRRGNSSSLEVSARYAYGLSTQFRAPDFADALTYAHAVNAALEGDGNAPRYSSDELDAIGKGLYPMDAVPSPYALRAGHIPREAYIHTHEGRSRDE